MVAAHVSAPIFVVLSLAGLVQSALGPRGDLHIVNKDVSPDGFTRSAVIAGSSFPGETITANKGDDFEINVINELHDNTMLRQTSVHFHGISMDPSTSWADGASGVTQCPISQGHSFKYSFNAGQQAGTYWYHSHIGSQYCDGLRGPLVIYDPQDPHKALYDVDDESTILTLGEWYHTVAPQVILPAVAESTLFNGKGRYIGGPAAELAVIKVEQNKRYRIRLISMSCEPNFQFKIDGHKFAVIEADGQNVVPTPIDSLTIYAGQRYSLVLNADQKPDNYWIRGNPNFGPADTYEGGVNSAILRYVGAPESEPTSSEQAGKLPLLETSLHPLTPLPPPGKPYVGGVELKLDVHMELDVSEAPVLKYKLNGHSYVPPTVPVLLQILSGAKSAGELMPTGSVYGIDKGMTVEVALFGGATGGPHPFHLHGHSFHVVKSAGNSTYNYVNPVSRDVVIVGNSTSEEDVTVIRFKADNAGPYMLHCHADWHMDIGMAMIFAENVPDTKDIKPPQEWKDLCPIYDALAPDQKDTYKPSA